jgi:hypothetical protein
MCPMTQSRHQHHLSGRPAGHRGRHCTNVQVEAATVLNYYFGMHLVQESSLLQYPCQLVECVWIVAGLYKKMSWCFRNAMLIQG